MPLVGGHQVLVMGMTVVVSLPTGQLVTVGAQLVMVLTTVLNLV